MTQLNQLISQIPSWQQLTPGQILDKLEEKTLRYVDTKTYRLVDIAKLIGDANMAAFLSVVKSAGYDWMITEAASGFIPGDDPINTRLRLLGHPLSLQIANHTNRMISVLEQSGLVPTESEIGEAKAFLLLEEQKQQLMTGSAIRWNQFCNAVDSWDGTEPRPEL